MEPQIICLNKECKEVPIIELINSDNGFRLKTDCPLHHYIYRLEDYLNQISTQDKKYNSICLKHKKKYEAFFKNTNVNLCYDCLSDERIKEKKIIYFKDIENDENECKKFSQDNNLSKLSNIVFNNYKDAQKAKKLLAGLYFNYNYINSFESEKSKYDDKVKIFSKIVDYDKYIKYFDNYEFEINLKYLFCSFEDKYIKVLNLETNICLNAIEDNSSKILMIELSPFYYHIFLTVSFDNVKIWEISEEKKELLQKSKIYLDNSRNEKFKFAMFSTLNEKIIFTVSDNYSVKIWNLEKIFCINEINSIEKFNNIRLSPDKESIIGFNSTKKIIIYNLNDKSKVIEMPLKNILYFNFMLADNIIVCYGQLIEIRNYKNNSIIKKIKNEYQMLYFFYHDEFLYIFSKYLIIIDLNNNNEKFNISEIKEKNFKFNDRIKFIKNNKANTDNIFLNFLLMESDDNLLISLKSKDMYKKSSNKKELKMNANYFFENNLKRLYNKSELSFNKIKQSKEEIYTKKYLFNEEISRKLKNNYNISLRQKKIMLLKSWKII